MLVVGLVAENVLVYWGDVSECVVEWVCRVGILVMGE